MDSNSKKIIEALAKIVNNQQKIIRKLAQQQPASWDDPSSQVQIVHQENAKSAPFTGQKEPAPQHMQPNRPTKPINDLITGGLPADLQPLVDSAYINQGAVMVRAKRNALGQNMQLAQRLQNETKNLVKKLQEEGQLFGQHQVKFELV